MVYGEYEYDKFSKKNPPSLMVVMNYKYLALNPEEELTKACRMIGVNFEDGMLNYYRFTRHNIGGNPTRMKKKTLLFVMTTNGGRDFQNMSCGFRGFLTSLLKTNYTKSHSCSW
jgi:hypothetical protein